MQQLNSNQRKTPVNTTAKKKGVRTKRKVRQWWFLWICSPNARLISKNGASVYFQKNEKPASKGRVITLLHERYKLEDNQLRINNKGPDSLYNIKVGTWISVAWSYDQYICFDPGLIVQVMRVDEGSMEIVIRYPKGEEGSDLILNVSIDLVDWRGGTDVIPTKEKQWRLLDCYKWLADKCFPTYYGVYWGLFISLPCLVLVNKGSNGGKHWTCFCGWINAAFRFSENLGHNGTLVNPKKPLQHHSFVSEKFGDY